MTHVLIVVPLRNQPREYRPITNREQRREPPDGGPMGAEQGDFLFGRLLYDGSHAGCINSDDNTLSQGAVLRVGWGSQSPVPQATSLSQWACGPQKAMKNTYGPDIPSVSAGRRCGRNRPLAETETV